MQNSKLDNPTQDQRRNTTPDEYQNSFQHGQVYYEEKYGCQRHIRIKENLRKASQNLQQKKMRYLKH
jgi:hypothetical protein